MGAECSKCGHGLVWEYPCGWCALKARAETAEADANRERELGKSHFTRAISAEAALEDVEAERDKLREALETLAWALAERGSVIPGGTKHPYNTTDDHKVWILCLHLRTGAPTIEQARERMADDLIEWALTTTPAPVDEEER